MSTDGQTIAIGEKGSARILHLRVVGVSFEAGASQPPAEKGWVEVVPYILNELSLAAGGGASPVDVRRQIS